MAPLASCRRRTALGLAMGVVAGAAFPRGLAIAATAPGDARRLHYRTVHHFSGLEGAEPRAGLVVGSDGQAYGTTNAGGEHGLGVVYRLTRDHRVKVLHSFAGGAQDGAYPFTASVVEADGDLYGSTFGGGAINGGVAYRLAPDGGFTILHDFGIPFRSAQSGELTLGSDGCFYGASEFGGRYDDGSVFRMDKAGAVTLLWSMRGRGPQMPLARPIEATDGRLYGTSTEGGADGLGGTVYTLRKDGSDARVLHSFPVSGEEGRTPADAVTQGADGCLYGVAMESGDPPLGGAGTVFRLGLDGAFEVIHFFHGDDGGGPHTPLLEIRPGTFLGATRYGGKANVGVVYQIHADGRFRVLHHFGGEAQGAPDGHEPWGALTLIDPDHVLGTCLGGGSSGLGCLWLLRADAG